MPGEAISTVLIGLLLSAIWLVAGLPILIHMERGE